MIQQNRSIKLWAEDDRPSLKLLSKGKKHLSDSELVAILINSGTKDKSAVDLAQEILHACNNNLINLSRKSIEELCKFKGIGEAKAITIQAGLELAKRYKRPISQKKANIGSSSDSYQILRPLLEDLNNEEFHVLFLNRGNRIIRHSQISSGGISQTVVDPRIIFKQAIDCFACGIILAHNHPSGQLHPSQQDVDITKKIIEFGKIIEIQVIDHLILTDYGYFSFADSGLL